MLSEKVVCEDGVQNYLLKSILRHTYVCECVCCIHLYGT